MMLVPRGRRMSKQGAWDVLAPQAEPRQAAQMVDGEATFPLVHGAPQALGV